MAEIYWLDRANNCLWRETEEDEGTQLVEMVAPADGDVLPLAAVEKHYGPLTRLVEAAPDDWFVRCPAVYTPVSDPEGRPAERCGFPAITSDQWYKHDSNFHESRHWSWGYDEVTQAYEARRQETPDR